MKTAISIPDEVFDKAEQLADQLGISRSELYAKAVESFLQARLAENVTEKLNEVYASERDELDPLLIQMQSASLAGDHW